MLNRTDRPQPMPGEAEIKYLDGDFRIVRPGAFVRCAVTGVPIPLEELRYWSVDLAGTLRDAGGGAAAPGALLTRSSSAVLQRAEHHLPKLIPLLHHKAHRQRAGVCGKLGELHYRLKAASRSFSVVTSIRFAARARARRSCACAAVKR